MRTFGRIFIAINVVLIIFVIFITRDGNNFTPSGDGEFVSRKPFSDVNKALSKWKELTSPRKVERKAENMPAGV